METNMTKNPDDINPIMTKSRPKEPEKKQWSVNVAHYSKAFTFNEPTS